MARVARHYYLDDRSKSDIADDLGISRFRVARMLEAARRPFRTCVGIEISPALAQIARENLARYAGPPLRCRDVRVVRADALTARLPRGDLVVYLYNPFDATVLAPLVDRLARRGAHETVLLYHTPVERATIKASLDSPATGPAPFLCQPTLLLGI